MGKLTTYTIFMTGIMLLFYFTGLLQECGDDGLCQSNTPNSAMLNLLMNVDDLRDLTFSEKAILVLEGVSAALIIATGVFIGNIELAAIGPFAIYYFNLGWDFLAVFNVVREANPVIATLIFAPFFYLYVIVIVDWWRGRD